MCDIYKEHCKICGEPTGFHLGDFNTDQLEISYICSKHDHQKMLKWLDRLNIPYIIWSEGEDKKYIVLSHTENAWKNRNHNHQNLARTKMIEEKPYVPYGR